MRQYKPKARTDGHVAFPQGSLSFPVPAEIPVTQGNSGNGKAKLSFSLGNAVPVTCVYRGNGGAAYIFKKCKAGALHTPDQDDDDQDYDDGPVDPLPTVGTSVTADTFTLRVNKGDKKFGTTAIHLHIGGPVIDDNNACTTDACNPIDGVTHAPVDIDDNNPCTIDTCNPLTGVSHTEVTSHELPPQGPVANGQSFSNPNGSHATLSTRDGAFLDTENPFFKSLGTNGRACVTCHTPEDGFGVSAEHIRQRFDASCGFDPIFRAVDGANKPHDPDGSAAAPMDTKRAAYSLLLNRGLIRIPLTMPMGGTLPPDPAAGGSRRNFEIVSVLDPYDIYNEGTSPATPKNVATYVANGISVYRRPLPSTNLKFANAFMWDGREGVGAAGDLVSQARNATLGHAEAPASPSAADLSAIVAFESALFTTQISQAAAGSTSAEGAFGDPTTLSGQPFTVGMNRKPGGLNIPAAQGIMFNTVDVNVFNVFNAWASSADANRQAVQRGQVIFNTRKMTDLTPGGLDITCSSCHRAANSGGMTLPHATPPILNFLSIRIAEIPDSLEQTVANPVTSTPGYDPSLPLFGVRQKVFDAVTGTYSLTGPVVYTADPGRAMISGAFADLSFFRTPQLRGLASRAPYFHDGTAATLEDVVDFYDLVMTRINGTTAQPTVPVTQAPRAPGFTAQEKSDLVAFLKSL